MRFALAVAAALLVALAAAAPHAHGGVFGSHACQACVAGGGEEASSASPSGPPAGAPRELLRAGPGLPPVFGRPQGAVPGQSPPRA